MYQVKESSSQTVVFNSSESEPKFTVTSLEPGHNYVFVVRAKHSRGMGPSRALMVTTRSPQEQRATNEIETVRASGKFRQFVQVIFQVKMHINGKRNTNIKITTYREVYIKYSYNSSFRLSTMTKIFQP